MVGLQTGNNSTKLQFAIPETKSSLFKILQEDNSQLQTMRDPLLNESDPDTSMSIESTRDPKRMSLEKQTFLSKARNQKNLAEHGTTVSLNLEPADFERLNNPQAVAHYAKEVTNYMKETEEKYLAKPNYMIKSQKDVNEKMRAIMIDWLIDVHLKFKLLPETLFLTVNLIDRYLELVPVPRQKLQLVGIASMLIACKYEEIYSPQVKDFVLVTDKAYTREEVLEMEGKLLSTLKFQLTAPSSFRFYERFAQLAKVGEKARHLGCYLLELSLIEYKMMRYTPSMLACGALYVAMRSEGNERWSEALVRSSRYEQQAVKNCAAELAMLAAPLHEKIALTAARRKYTLTKYGEVARVHLGNF